MIAFSGTEEFQIQEPTVVTIGKFDGRHVGHQKLLGCMLEWKKRRGYKTAVFTFDMSPAACLTGLPQKVITTNQERRDNMEKMGIDYLVEYPFTKEVSHLPPEEFLKKILLGRMNARAIVVGTDCSFGYRRLGDAALLKRRASDLGYEVEIIEKEADQEHRIISSTYVKEELDQGNLEKAEELLGQPYAIHGTVIHGNHMGGPVLGFPTANILPPPEKYLPPFGVYVSRVLAEGAFYEAVTNIGRKPTVSEEEQVGVETYLFGFNRDLYGSYIEVQLLHFLRPEQRFSDLSELQKQIRKDREAAASYFAKKRENRH